MLETITTAVAAPSLENRTAAQMAGGKMRNVSGKWLLKARPTNRAVAFFVYLAGSAEVTPDLHHTNGYHWPLD